MLSKSLFIKGLQCQKALWLKMHKSDVLTPPSEQAKAIFETGQKVGNLAKELFLNGKEVQYEGTTREQRAVQTKQWLDDGVQTIYEATFIHDDMQVMVDILHKNGDSWEIYEVKSSTENDDPKKHPVKDVYLDDASAQYYVVSGAGLKVSKVHVTLINKRYVLGDEIDAREYFKSIDVTQEVLERQDIVRERLKEFKRVVVGEDEYIKEIGYHCKHPYDCDAMEYCWKTLAKVPEFSIYDLLQMRENPTKTFATLHEQGIIDVADIPDDFKLTDIQKLQVDAWKYKDTHTDKEAIAGFLNKITYPVYHLDFETCNAAVPMHKGTRPFQQVAFQYSLHIEHEDGTLEHKEFLAQADGIDPRRAFAQSLIENIPAGVCVTAYNERFERNRIEELRALQEEFRPTLDGILANVVDLMEPFSKKYYYHWSLKGRFSIKLIMPLLTPHMADAYKKLKLVKNGGDAMNTFPRLIDMDEADRQEHREALLEYCKLDTLSMVEVHRALRKLAQS